MLQTTDRFDGQKMPILSFLLGVILMGACLRAPITAVGVLISSIRADLGLSAAAAGMITTIPLLAFAFVSPFVSAIGRKKGYERTLALGLLVTLCGCLLRSVFGVAGLFAGMTATAYADVLAPTVIKLRKPDAIGIYMGIYAVAMAVGSGIAAAISAPLAVRLPMGWKGALLLWAILLAAGAALWYVLHLGRPEGKIAGSAAEEATVSESTGAETVGAVAMTAKATGTKSLYKDAMAWWVTIMTGVQSLLYYCFVAWLPTILADKGFAAETAGALTTLNQLAGLPMSFFIPILAARKKEQKGLALLMGAVYLGGMGLLFATTDGTFIAVALILAGLGAGSAMSLGTTVLTLRAADADCAARLAGMSQLAGYLLAAVGPTMFGFLYDRTGGWTAGFMCMFAAILVMTATGVLAGRNRKIG